MKKKTFALATIALLAFSTARAENLDTTQEVVTLPAFVVETSRLEVPSVQLGVDVNRTIREASTLAERTSGRSLNRLRAHLTPGSRHFARRAGQSVRSRA